MHRKLDTELGGKFDVAGSEQVAAPPRPLPWRGAPLLSESVRRGAGCPLRALGHGLTCPRVCGSAPNQLNPLRILARIRDLKADIDGVALRNKQLWADKQASLPAGALFALPRLRALAPGAPPLGRDETRRGVARPPAAAVL